MALISVIIPVYNSQNTIKDTIESVLNQSFTDFELIIINDGSPDASLDVIGQVKDERIRVFSYPHAGANASRNRGVDRAKGDYISFLDADDLWTPDKLECQLKALQDNPEAAVAYSWTNCIDESGNFLRRGSYCSFSGEVYAQLLLIDFLENGSNPLIRREALTTVGKFDQSLTHAEDWDMWLRLAASYPFVAVPSPQILYRVSADSASNNLAKMEADCLRVIERAFAHASPSIQHLKRYSIANIYIYLIYKALAGSPSREKAKLAAQFLRQVIRYNPSLLKAPVLAKILLKVVAFRVMTPKQAQLFLRQMGGLSKIEAWLGYLKVEPD
jgi:glycosyltransferase involved in cell wall biosynthesis